MKKIFTFFFLVMTFTSYAQNKKISALFLGNSYTYVNNLPQLVHDLALAKGDTLMFDSYTQGGYTLQNHATDVNAQAKLNSYQWQYVILQAQSQEPSLDPDTVKTNTLTYVLKLDSIIKHNDSCTVTTFFETWGRKYGDASNCGIYPPVCTYAGMQDRLKCSYKMFADTIKGVWSPAGEAFRLCRQLDSTINLYQSDYSHPSPEGSYLAACVFYEVLFYKSILNDTFASTLSASAAAFLQQVAHTTVTDSLALYNIGVNVPYAPYTFTGNSLQYQFTGLGGFAHSWDFGDGSTSAQISPLHTYASSQTYTVSHVVTSNCPSDSSVQILIAGISDMPSAAHPETYIFPNPAKELLNFGSIGPHRVKIFSVAGILLGEFETNAQGKLDVSSLAPGYYLAQVGISKPIPFVKE